MGGYVYITTGLVGMCDKEEELAGVIAHECAHIKKRHIAKRMEKEKYLNIGMISTMLLAMLVGGGSTPEAIITAGLAGTQTMGLNIPAKMKKSLTGKDRQLPQGRLWWSRERCVSEKIKNDRDRQTASTIFAYTPLP